MDNRIIKVSRFYPAAGKSEETMTLKQAEELFTLGMFTILPNGRTANTYKDLLEFAGNTQEEIEVFQFPMLSGG